MTPDRPSEPRRRDVDRMSAAPARAASERSVRADGSSAGPATLPLPGWRVHHVAILYALFALLSIALNLGVQQIAVMALAGRTKAVLPLSMLCGTGAGFVSKYVLDKNFIFFDVSARHRDEARKLALYGFFSVFTTALFWASEAGFLWLFGTVAAKYSGAVVGLVLGYGLKFALDRSFTFKGRRRL